MKKITLIIILAIIVGLIPRPKAEKLDAAPSRKYTRIGKASWYSKHSPGINRRTANNEFFNDNRLTAAMWGVEFGREIKVTNLDNGNSVIVRVNDRGPHEKFIRKGRIIDLTKAAFSQLSPTTDGIITVELEFL